MFARRIAVIGTGYVGLTTGACLASLGHHVVCADIDPDKIDRLNDGQIDILEPGLPELVSEGVAAGRLEFVLGARQAICFPIFWHRRRAATGNTVRRAIFAVLLRLDVPQALGAAAHSCMRWSRRDARSRLRFAYERLIRLAVASASEAVGRPGRSIRALAENSARTPRP